MKILVEVEIGSDGIIKQMQNVRAAGFKLRQEMDKLNGMLDAAKVKEIGDSEESPVQD